LKKSAERKTEKKIFLKVLCIEERAECKAKRQMKIKSLESGCVRVQPPTSKFYCSLSPPDAFSFSSHGLQAVKSFAVVKVERRKKMVFKNRTPVFHTHFPSTEVGCTVT